MSDEILSFSGDFRFLSNFWAAPIVYEGQEFLSTEAAYQAAKTLNLTEHRSTYLGQQDLHLYPTRDTRY